MKKRVKINALISLLFGLALPAFAAVAESRHHYIVILKPGKGADPDIASFGGTVDERQYDWMMLTMPDDAVDALRKNERVKYVQRTLSPGEAAPPRDNSPVHGHQVAAQSVVRLVPKSTGTGNWCHRHLCIRWCREHHANRPQ